MDYRKYRACMLGIAAFALAVGILFFMKYAKEQEIPADGTLVKNCEYAGSEALEWA